MTAKAKSAAAIEEEAARWLLRREEAGWSRDDDADLDAWIDQSMAHRAAFWRLEHGWAAADRVAALGPIGPALRRRTRWIRPIVDTLRRPQALAAIAATLVFAMVGSVWFAGDGVSPVPAAPERRYVTARGGAQTLKLADGSRVQMNTATTLRTTAAGDRREVWLDDGEAYFDIVHRPDRTFVVHAGRRTITVLGTRFIVRRAGDNVTVAVLSGRVRVDDAEPATEARSRSAVVTTGDIAVAGSRATLITNDTPSRVDAIAAWRDGMIIFDKTPLSEAVAEFNRYSTKAIRIDDPELAGLRIGGSFQTKDREAFVELMERAYHVRVRTEGAVTILDR
ncbi:MAG TPA: FecR domain-containing protein [Sphingomonas sp.]|nr:FecR domain-containing protein [Sphingomonas sp.]